MHYHTYNTPGFILNAAPAGESSRYVFIFTRDLGLVGAHAQNTRSISSKLRYSISAPAKSVVSLVRGKNVWRLISAVPDKQLFYLFRDEPDKLKLCVQVFALYKKILAGEEANPELYSLLENFIEFLEKEKLDSEQIKNAETVFIVRFLKITGYLPDEKITKEISAGREWNTDLLSGVSLQRKDIVRIINESLKAADL